LTTVLPGWGCCVTGRPAVTDHGLLAGEFIIFFNFRGGSLASLGSAPSPTGKSILGSSKGTIPELLLGEDFPGVGADLVYYLIECGIS
jgi:hypothetical protein